MHTEDLDHTDLEILRILQKNARLTTKELAAQVHLSTTPVFERQKRLERMGYIRKYVAVLDADKLNRGFVVFCNVKLRRINREIAQDFIERIKEVQQVSECYNISGNFWANFCNFLKICNISCHCSVRFSVTRI